MSVHGLPDAVMQLLEGSVDAAVVLDRDRRILYFNSAYQAIAGTNGRKLQAAVQSGSKCFEIVPLSICETSCVGCRARKAGRPLRVHEIEAIRGDEQMTFIVAAIPIGDELIIETYRDVTAEVRIQSRLKVLLERERQAKEDLEEKVIERTRELKQAHAQLVLQEKMSALGRLVAGIAHELNNPINFVYGNVDFLDEYIDGLLSLVRLVDEHPSLTQDLRERIERHKVEIEYDFLVKDSVKLISSIRTGAERTASIVRDLKNFSRSGSGDRQQVDIVPGIETTLNLIAPLLKNRIDIRRNYQEDLPRIVCNAGHINQVFMNILTNAAQAIEGEGWIEIAARATDGGDFIEITVSDSGQGIDEASIARISDPFYTTKDVGEGTGLGLWITQSIVRNHGGSLTCESVLGKGSVFTVKLPLHPPPAEPGTELTYLRTGGRFG